MAKLLPPGYCIVEQHGPLAFQAQQLLVAAPTMPADNLWRSMPIVRG